jgi:hypothetical protein
MLAYRDNELAADRQYKGRWLSSVVSIASIRNEGDGAVIELEVEHPEVWGFSARYHFDAGHKAEVEHLHVGGAATIVGLCNGRSDYLEMLHCAVRE